MAAQRTPGDGWLSLTWDDLEEWAGARSVERGRSYQRGERVKKLAITDAGELLATVRGSYEPNYTTTVSLKPGKAKSLASNCTCPVGLNCKHAVAVIAEYLDAVAKGRAVAKTDGNDPRWADLDDLEDSEDEGYDEYEDEGYDEEYNPPARPSRTTRSTKAKRTSTTDADIEQYIRAKSQGELADLVVSFTHRFPELHTEFKERLALMSGDVARIVAEARKEIRQATAEPYYDRWDDYGSGTPDFGPIRHRFERLLELGHPDEVVSLGREFIRAGQEQIGRSNDEGETAMEFTKVMPVIFRAVAASSMPAPERLLFAIEAVLEDEYDALGDGVNEVLEAKWKPDDWSAVADQLAKRLTTKATGEDSFTRDYRRRNVARWLTRALAEAGRDTELEPIYEKEAQATGSYEEIVGFYLQKGRFDDAAKWAREGIAATASKWPGIADHLAATLCDLAAKQKRWDVVAAHAAFKFFAQPHRGGFDELVSAAKKAGVEKPVRAMALRFLETGAMPYRLNTSTTKAKATPAKPSTAVRKASEPRRVVPPSRIAIDPDWPLPVPDYLEPMLEPRGRFHDEPRPRLDVLIDMAVAAKNPAEVLKWYDAMRAKPKGHSDYYTGVGYADRVAKAVADTHPERALEIYTAALNAQLPNASASAYEAAAGYLKKLRPIYEKLKRSAEWDALVTGIREKYRNRPKFMETLDKMQGSRTTIVDAARKKRK